MASSFQSLACEALRFDHRDIPAVDEVSLNFAPGELVAIVGPNGCGKSTLLKLLIGALPPRSGNISLDGTPLHQWSRIALARRMALVPQMATTGESGAAGMGGGFTVQQHVLMARYASHVDEAAPMLRAAGGIGIFGFETANDADAATRAMWDADVHHLIDRDLDALSGGERQRVAIARAFTQETPILLLDEPTSALDLYHQLELVEQLRTITRAGKLVILVTHDLHLAHNCATRTIVMNQGKIAADGNPLEVLTPEVLEPVYQVGVHSRAGMLEFHRKSPIVRPP